MQKSYIFKIPHNYALMRFRLTNYLHQVIEATTNPLFFSYIWDFYYYFRFLHATLPIIS